ncbi:MAG: carboxypeptidase regulatory-like domain-containing protein [Bryobacteraceae bacterium]
MNLTYPSRRILALILCLGYGAVLQAQINRGTIEGIVTDPQGGVVPNVEVTITATETNLTTVTRTNDTGYYRVVDLVPGPFQARFSAPGFATVEVRAIDVQAGNITRVDGILKVGATSQTVEVTAESPLIESSASNFSTILETKTIQDTPLQGRDLQQLVFLIPGINNVGGPPGSNFGFNSAYGTFPDPTNALGSNVAVNGGQAGANAWYLDGNLNLSSFAENAVINPVPDAVEEFQAITNAFAPEYSRTGGGVFNVVLKSGTNSFHGDVYEFLRNDATNARNPFTSIDANGNLIKDRQLRFNNFGGTFGGPVWIPKIYNGRNKTFFFFSLDQTVLHLLGNKVFSVPTALMRQGNFSEDPSVVSNGIYNPYSTVGPDSSGVFHRQPFLNPNGSLATAIPKRMLDPTATYFLNSFPLPNYNDPLSSCPMGTSGFLICDNYLGGVGSSQNPAKLSLKFDHQASEKSHFFAEWLYSPTPYRNYRVPWTGPSFPYDQVGWGAAYPYDMSSNIISFGNSYLIAPTLVNEFRASFTRQYITTHPSHPYPDSITDQTGVMKALQADQIPSNPYFPVPYWSISSPGGGSITFGPTAWVNMNTGAEAYTILDNVTKTIGKHTLKTGFIYRLEHSSYESSFPTEFDFRGGLTSDPITGLGGNGLAQFELGAISSNGRESSTGVMWQPYESYKYWGAFVQDDFRITKNFTLNIGLRYDVNGLYSVRTHSGSNFCLTCMDPYTGLKGKVVYEGSSPQFPKGPIAPAHKNDLGPRLNFSWSPFADRKTVLRGGYDIFYSNAFTLINSPGQSASNAPGWNQEYDWQGSVDPSQCAPHTGQCVAFRLSDPTTNKASLTTPPMSNGFPAARHAPLYGQLIQFFTPPSHDPMVQTWNFEIERELPGNMMLDVGYVGTHGTHLVGEAFQQFNYVHTADLLKYKNAINTVVPISSVYSGQTAQALQQIWGSSTLPLSILLKPYPAYGTVQNNVGFEGKSTYNALNLRFQKRYSRGLTFVAAYTFSKLMTNPEVANLASMMVDPIHWTRAGGLGGRAGALGLVYGGGFQNLDNKNADRAVGASDTPQMFNFASSYELPFGKGKPLLNHNALLDALIGGWHLSGDFNAQSGLPLSISCPGNEITSRCNIVGDPNFHGSRSKAQKIADWINPAAFEPPFGSDQSFWANYSPTDNRAWQFGNAGIRLPYLRGPGFWNLDSSLSKQFHVGEARYFELRWEVFNTLNHMNLASPNTSFCLPPPPGGSTDRVHQAGCQFGRITNVQTDPRSMQFSLKFAF